MRSARAGAMRSAARMAIRVPVAVPFRAMSEGQEGVRLDRPAEEGEMRVAANTRAVALGSAVAARVAANEPCMITTVGGQNMYKVFKGIANARRYLARDHPGKDIAISLSRVVEDMAHSLRVDCFLTDAHEETDDRHFVRIGNQSKMPQLAGYAAAKLREGEKISFSSLGWRPTMKSLVTARILSVYAERDGEPGLRFYPSFHEVEGGAENAPESGVLDGAKFIARLDVERVSS